MGRAAAPTAIWVAPSGRRCPEGAAAQRYRDTLLADVGVRRASGLAVAFGRAEFVPDAEGADRLLLVPTTDGTPRRRRRRDGDPQPVLDETRRWPTCGRRLRPWRCCGSTAIPRRAVPPAARSRGGRDRLRQPWPGRGDAGGHGRPTRRCASSSAGPSARSRPSSTPAPTCWCRSRWRASSSTRRCDALARRPGDVAASMAKSYACGSGRRRRRQGHAAARRHRIHVGERHSRLPQRATLNRSLFGSPAAHRRQLAHRYL